LKTVTAPFDADSRRRSKSVGIASSARDEPSTVLTSKYECSLLNAGNNYDTLGFIKEIERNTFIWRGHHLVKTSMRVSQALIRSFFGTVRLSFGHNKENNRE
jgi:hypothetical protein